MIHSKVINIIVDPDLLICIHSLKTLRSRVMPNTPYTSITHTVCSNSMTPLKQCANHQFRENTTNRRPFSLVSNALSLAATSSTNRVSQSVSHCHHCKRISDICSSQPERRSVTKSTHTHRHTLLPFAEWTACYCGYLQPSRRVAASESVRFPRQKRPARGDVSAVPSPDFFRTPERTRTDDESKDVFFFFFFLGRSHEKKKKLSRQHFICAIPRRRLARGCHPSPPALSPPARPRRAASDVIRVSHGEEPILSFSSSPTVDGSLSGYMNKYM